MDPYSIVKTVHILSANILFGTGIGTAFFFWRAHRAGNETGRLFAAKTTVLADLLFTTPAVIVQPLSGAWMIWRAGLQWNDLWLTTTYALYLLAALCWLPVVAIQLHLKGMLEREAAGHGLDRTRYERLFRIWFMLGWPAFGGLVIVYFLMVMRPSW
ncbi:DUF2269 domain-containing protein [Sphingomonas flavescens]|uniref:DUF2269 family protein n=1 Tax=Sphingomonas flavescens TaxID=3132797 RepID=UPI00280485BE|nr:DUF2269 domain-containing protein [Sphingomonas limnosediminicola]